MGLATPRDRRDLPCRNRLRRRFQLHPHRHASGFQPALRLATPPRVCAHPERCRSPTGSTKIITVIFTYADIFLGLPLRVVGGTAVRLSLPFPYLTLRGLSPPITHHTAQWRGLEDKAIGGKEAQLPPEEKKRPWWKGPKPREEVEIEDVRAFND